MGGYGLCDVTEHAWVRLVLSGRVGPDGGRLPRPAEKEAAAAAAAAAATKTKTSTNDNKVTHAIKEVKAKRATGGKRKRWSAEEEEALRKGIKKCVCSPPLLSCVTTPGPKPQLNVHREMGLGAGSSRASGPKSSPSTCTCSRGARRLTSRIRCVQKGRRQRGGCVVFRRARTRERVQQGKSRGAYVVDGYGSTGSCRVLHGSRPAL